MSAERRYYVDTSAWLSVVLGHGPALIAEFRGAQLVSSVLLVIEAHRNLVRLAREGQIDADQLQQALEQLDRDLELMELQDVDMAFTRDRTMPVLTTPKSLDLIHLRTAVQFHQEQALTRFVSLDRGLNAAARELGLPV